MRSATVLSLLAALSPAIAHASETPEPTPGAEAIASSTNVVEPEAAPSEGPVDPTTTSSAVASDPEPTESPVDPTSSAVASEPEPTESPVDPTTTSSAAEPDPQPTSSPAPTMGETDDESSPSASAVSPALDPVADPSNDRNAAVDAFSARRGFRMATAGTAIAAAGVGWVGVSGWMLSNDDPRAGLGLALVVNGGVLLTVGMGLSIAGGRRIRGGASWVDASPGRRARLTRAAEGFDPHFASTLAESAVVAKGHKMRTIGLITLTSGVGLLAFGSALTTVYPGDNVAVKAVVPAVSAPFIIAGAVLLAKGGHRIHNPHLYTTDNPTASRPTKLQLTAAPTFHRGGLGLGIAGRF